MSDWFFTKCEFRTKRTNICYKITTFVIINGYSKIFVEDW